jgi:transcriptional regulator with XRE-family HTH domain
MKFLQQSLIPDPLGAILAKARQKKRLSLDQAARNAGIPEAEAAALEGDKPLPPGTARLHALSYARSLGIDISEIRDSLPPVAGISTSGNEYLGRIANPGGKRRSFSPDVLKGFLHALAPLGRAVLYLVLIAILLSTWGIMRQLSRVRSIPWVTTNSRPITFHDR